MIEDVRYALRQLRKNPGFAAAAVMTLGLGIGSAAAMFGLIQGVLLSPPPYTDPDRLVLSPRPARRPALHAGSHHRPVDDWRSDQRRSSRRRCIDGRSTSSSCPTGASRSAAWSSRQNFFKAIGVKPILGPGIRPAEASRPKVPATGIILGYELWQRKFNGDPNVVGTTVRISRYPAPLPVVGIMPAGVRFLPDPGSAAEPNYDVNAHVDFWLSVAPDETQPRARGWNAVAGGAAA